MESISVSIFIIFEDAVLDDDDFTFYLYSRIAHIRLLLKFLFKILVVLRITSNLNIVKVIWLHFL